MARLVVHEGDRFHQVEEFGSQGGRSFGRLCLANPTGKVAQPIRDGVIPEVGVEG
ncbi:hypothetical protein DAETH_47190 (plasmid) [Deinococcus aetherius]|uniref:Uncharacterized protein n=1 Tax=Deinococcus aetherius TaxID=200252 RepID=A0ABN6RN63_9DEIO|nr:hypothetical protein DAETH_47190 [Deinococcus aetherius]